MTRPLRRVQCWWTGHRFKSVGTFDSWQFGAPIEGTCWWRCERCGLRRTTARGVLEADGDWPDPTRT